MKFILFIFISLLACNNTKQEKVFFDSGCQMQSKGDYTSAIKDFDKAININPNYAEAYFCRGIAKSAQDNFQEALLDFDKAIEINPNYAEAYYRKGVAEGAIGNYQDALKDLNKAIEFNPNVADAYFWRGQAKISLKDYQGAILDFDKVIEIKPNHTVSIYNKACLFSILKNDTEMLKFLKQAIALDNNNKEKAKNDADFKEYWSDPAFIDIVK